MSGTMKTGIISVRIERIRRNVSVLPHPIHDERTTAEIKARLTEEDGWHHHAYAVSRFCATAKEARELAESLEKGFADARPVRVQ